jgi:acyl-CoA synthetase (AMP-forming)/AMP-acid ligase II
MRCVSLMHRNLLAVIHGLRQVYYFEKGSHWMSNLPLHHSFGFVLELLMPVLHDISLRVVKQQVSEEEFMEELERFKPAVVIATPTQLELIAGLSQKRNIPFLTHVFTAGLHPENQQVETLTQRGIDVMVCAGMNETSSVFAVNLHNYRGKDIAGKWMEQENRNEDSIGKPLPGVALRICNASGAELPVGSEGVICIKGSAVAPTSSDEIECNPVLVDGWFNSGLTGSLDHKGFVRITE